MAHSSKETRDIYYRKAKQEGYRARSAYKLLQIFQSFKILHPSLDIDSALALLRHCACGACAQPAGPAELQKVEPANGACADGGTLWTRIKSSLCSIVGPLDELDASPACSCVGSDFDSDFALDDYVAVRRDCRSLGRVRNVIDLCAAPGSWSQVLRNLVFHDFKILKEACAKLQAQGPVCQNLVEQVEVEPVVVAIDLQRMEPLEGVHILRGDITDPKVLMKVKALFEQNVARNIARVAGAAASGNLSSKAQLITCDGAPDVSGLHEIDSCLQFSLIQFALSACFSLLEAGGVFICKTFAAEADSPPFVQVSGFFDFCELYKPHSSRSSSFEHFIVAQGFRPLGSLLRNPFGCDDSCDEHEVDAETRAIVEMSPEILAGDLAPFERLTKRRLSANPPADKVA